ncbi:hypothetical protein G6011_04900 [Alternaria panax]|uniref:Uncharacterized protein n=1 Tax=Alternaria panax TaxID=48097 RepID=A0AAD4IHR1_9PLEO|nr:hypothetical protein G6011_04900 [Alternaria panax]
MSNLQYSMSALDPTAEPIPSPSPLIQPSPPSTANAKAESTTNLLTTLCAHRIMLTDLYLAQNNAYVSAYTAFAMQCAAGDMAFTEMKNAVAKLLGQQKEMLLFQTFLWSFQALVVGLEGDEVDNGCAAGRRGTMIGNEGGRPAKGFNDMWC